MVTKEGTLISVIMGVYNQWDKDALYEAMMSILQQTYTNFEFIIYDDGSHPEAAGYLKELSRLDKRILLIGREENHGLAFSLNTCIAYARGAYIARMDADDRSHPFRLEVQYQFMEQHPEYAWCGCNAILFDENGAWGRRMMPEVPSNRDYLKYSPYIHPTVMYRAEVIRACGGYLESKETMRCEDYEIFMRLQQRGLTGCNLQQELFYYRENKKSFDRRTFTHRISEMKVRYRNFRKMGLLLPYGWLYVARPVIGGMVPAGMIAWLKRNEAKKRELHTGIPATIYEGLERRTANEVRS